MNKPDFQKVTVMRHGATTMNSKDVLKGQLDVPLSQKGIDEAHRLAGKLKSKGLELLAYSDLKRAQKTAKIISSRLGIETLKDSALRPWDFGNLTGKPVKTSLQILINHVKNVPNKSLPGGESFNAFKTRFLKGLTELLKENKGKRIGIITHSRDDKLLDAWEKKGFSKNLLVDENEFLKTFEKKGLKPGQFKDKVIKL